MRAALAILIAAAAWGEDAWVIAHEGATLRAGAAQELTRAVRFDRVGPAGMQATVFPASLRGVRSDDLRSSHQASGTFLDPAIDHPSQAFAGPELHQRLKIGGHPGDWDNFTVQWDGLVLVPVGGVDFATSSDDGSRMWIDRDRDGRISPNEWGGNGWGGGQGTTLRQVHAGVPAGTWTIRVQYEEGGGGNACTLLWRPATGGEWTPVPAPAFARTPVLDLAGPVTVRAAFSGDGELRCGDGVRLASVPGEGSTVIADGSVALAADLDLGRASLVVMRSAVLDLAGHRLVADRIDGDGAIALGGGELRLATGDGLTVTGRGVLRLAGELRLAGLAEEAEVVLDTPSAAVRSPGRCVLGVELRSPLSTVVELDAVPATASDLRVVLDGQLAGAGLAAWRADRHGRWFQRIAAAQLRDGRQEASVDLSVDAPLLPVGHGAAWNPATAAESPRAGLLIYADRPLTGRVRIETRWQGMEGAPRPPHLEMLRPQPSRIATGQRTGLSVRPVPFPDWPLDQDRFALDLAVTGPDGSTTRYAGFVDQPFRRIDRGDREDLLADGPPCFSVRWRAGRPGTHRLRLEARWEGGRQAAIDLPPVEATGPAWDDIARVDAGDPRFLSSQGAFVWPIGQNLNSTYDVRSRGALDTRLTPDRGTFTREAFLSRLAAAGGTGAETWLSPWNLGLEWTDDWRGYHGAGRPNLGNAWALDRYLDLAERNGMRIVVSIFNHGQGRDGSGAEDDWPHHPWRRANGGWLDGPPGLFTDARARKRQSDLFRYLAARWGDSPAVLAWKLWAEVNLVHAPIEQVRSWHVDAAALFDRHDPWRHPVTTHWCGDWRNPDPEISAQPGMRMLTIDAYHGGETMVAELLGQSTRSASGRDGLWGYGKPILVTEYGGSAGACPSPRMEAEHAVGGWAAFVHGHAGAPMLWWFEWIDQGDRYAPFGALRRFTAGEDLRDPQARAVAPAMRAGSGRIWCRAWQRKGRMLGYAVDHGWAMQGGDANERSGGQIEFGSVNPGPMTLQWWDADRGTVVSALRLDHAGGQLRADVPAFRRHIAFKLWRE